MAEESLLALFNKPEFTEEIAVVNTNTFKRVHELIFAQNKSADLWAQLVAVNAGVQNGDMYLIRPEPYPPLELGKVVINLITGKQFWAIENTKGQIQKIRYDEPKKGEEGWVEHNESIILLHQSQGIVVCRCDWKRTKSSAFHQMCESLKIAKTPVWPTLSDAHTTTMAITEPRFRFTATIRVVKGTGKVSGENYEATDAVILPTTLADWNKISDFCTSKEGNDALEDMGRSYRQRLEYIDKCPK